MSLIQIRGNKYFLRKASEQDVPSLRILVNQAYKELSEMGLNYTATYQDEPKTLERIKKGEAFALINENEIIGTILFSQENHFTAKNTAYISQFAVKPTLKKNGIGSFLMDHCETLAKDRGFEGVQLDTAIPAEHLVKWYLKRGYKIVGKTHWEDKTYDSYIFEKSFR